MINENFLRELKRHFPELNWERITSLRVVRQDLNKGDKTPVNWYVTYEVCRGARVKWIIFGGANTVLDHKSSIRKKKCTTYFPVLRMVPYRSDQVNLVTESQ